METLPLRYRNSAMEKVSDLGVDIKNRYTDNLAFYIQALLQNQTKITPETLQTELKLIQAKLSSHSHQYNTLFAVNPETRIVIPDTSNSTIIISDLEEKLRCLLFQQPSEVDDTTLQEFVSIICSLEVLEPSERVWSQVIVQSHFTVQYTRYRRASLIPLLLQFSEIPFSPSKKEQWNSTVQDMQSLLNTLKHLVKVTSHLQHN